MATRGTMLNFTLNFVVETCCTKNCGMQFALPEDFYDQAQKDHDIWFYCPRGHRQHYIGETEEQKLRRRLREEQERAAGAIQRERTRRLAAEDQRDAAERSKAATKGALTKAKKRAINGVCPCCNRHFANVQSHMEEKHPKEFARANPTINRPPKIKKGSREKA